MKVKIADKSDWNSISEISKASGYEDWINEVGEQFLESGTVLLAEDDRPIAFMKMEIWDDNSAWLGALRVHPDSRRIGVGTTLSKEAIDIARGKGANFARLLIEPTNSKSIGLATKLGFSKLNEFSFFSGTIKTSNFVDVEFDEEVYVNLGWVFLKYPDFSRIEGGFLTGASITLFHHIFNGNTLNQTLVRGSELQGLETVEDGYTTVPSVLASEMSKLLPPFDEFRGAYLYELNLTG